VRCAGGTGIRSVPRRVALLLVMLALAGRAAAQSSTGTTLTIDQAEQLALAGNRPVKAAVLMADRADRQVEALRTRRLPNFDLRALGGSLLAPLAFDFPAGSLGTYPATGPIPFADTEITSPARPAFGVLFTVAQPLTQLHKVSLGTRALEVGRDLAREEVRLKQAELVTNVKKAYFGLLQAEATLHTIADAETLLTELKREVGEYVSRQVALPADALAVDTRLAETTLNRVKAENAVASLKEQLNVLMGRELGEPLEVVMPPDAETQVDLAAAQQRAVEQRPEVRDADLKAVQADYRARLTRADRLPDVSVMAGYLGMYNVAVLPRDTLGVGIYLSWEPFDWGRRRLEQEADGKAADAAALGKAEARALVRADVSARYRTLAEARAALHVAEVGADAAAENLRVAKSRYDQQATLLKDLLDAQLSMALARQHQQEAQLAVWTARAELEHAMGDAAP
jgi:outer membrane protein